MVIVGEEFCPTSKLVKPTPALFSPQKDSFVIKAPHGQDNVPPSHSTHLHSQLSSCTLANVLCHSAYLLVSFRLSTEGKEWLFASSAIPLLT